MTRLYWIFCILLVFSNSVHSQRKVAITIDDVPKTSQYYVMNKEKSTFEVVDELDIPVAIFINEGLLKNKQKRERIDVLSKWIKHQNVTVGTHTYSHPHYSKVGIKYFEQDIMKGMFESDKLSSKYGKQINYFRFPYNDLGKDSLQHHQAQVVLDSLNLISTPFTVESSDWMFNTLYEYYMQNDSIDKAKAIGDAYVKTTHDNFLWMDSISSAQFGRSINHIYLCHDNSINTDYLPVIIEMLHKMGCEFVSLSNAMEDEVYRQHCAYYMQWGISWVYRWMNNSHERNSLMKQAPDVMDYYELYERINAVKSY